MSSTICKLFLILILLCQLFTSLSARASSSLSSLSSSSIAGSISLKPVRQCEPINIEICENIGYNMTGMPNQFGYETQKESELLIQSFLPLIQFNCASQLKFFLCSAYVPMCTEKIANTIGPCRPLCENVRDRCQQVLKEFGFPWPINCSMFPPENNHEYMCMEGPKPSEAENDDTSSSPAVTTLYETDSHSNEGSSKELINFPTKFGQKVDENKHKSPNSSSRNNNNNNKQQKIPSVTKSTPNQKININNCNDYKYSEYYHFINSSKRCAQNCSANLLFTEQNKLNAEIWLLIFALLTIFLCLLTFITFTIDKQYFKYPERIIIYICLNYVLICLAYFVHLYFGRYSLSCYSIGKLTLLLQDGPYNISCALIAGFIYFFTMSSYIWWVIICFIWCVITTRKLNLADIDRASSYFFIFTIGIPAIKVVAIMLFRLVDTDELTGVCFVGNQSKQSLLLFLILPISIYLLLGILFLLIGLISFAYEKNFKFKQQKRLRKNQSNHHHNYQLHNQQQQQQQNHDSTLTSTSSICSTYRSRPINAYQLQSKRKFQQFNYNFSSSSTSSAISHTNTAPNNQQTTFLLNNINNNGSCNERIGNSNNANINDLHNSSITTATTTTPLTGNVNSTLTAARVATVLLNTKENSILITRLGVYAFTFIVPMCFLLFAYIYEYLYRDEWLSKYSKSVPNVQIFILRICVSLIIGIKTGFWIWSTRQPIIIWSNLFRSFSIKRNQVKNLSNQYSMVTNNNNINNNNNVNNNSNNNNNNNQGWAISGTKIGNFR